MGGEVGEGPSGWAAGGGALCCVLSSLLVPGLSHCGLHLHCRHEPLVVVGKLQKMSPNKPVNQRLDIEHIYVGRSFHCR